MNAFEKQYKYMETGKREIKVAKIPTQIHCCMNPRSCPLRNKNCSGVDFILGGNLLLAFFECCAPWSPADSVLRRFDAERQAFGSKRFGAAALKSEENREELDKI